MSIAATMPASDLPFEFNYDKGSVVTGENVLTQAVSSDGMTVFKVDDPQPIKKYNSANNANSVNGNSNNKNFYATYANTQTPKYKYSNNKNKNNNRQDNYNLVTSEYENPNQHSTSYSLSSSNTQWILENIGKYVK